jgi:hypothetical protein
MSRSARLALVVLVAGGFGWGVVGLFNRQFASGEVYPAFSSMRTDGMGTKLLYESLGKVPGVSVDRNFAPLQLLPRDGVAVLLLGMNPVGVNWNEGLLLQAAEAAARRGDRIVIAMYVDPEKQRLTQSDFERRPEPIGAGRKQPAKNETPPIRSMWGVALQFDAEAGAGHGLSFREFSGWKVLARGDAGVLTIEREFGKGSVVLTGESADFTNGAAVELRGLPQVVEAVGEHRQVVFDEQHLGIAESGSIVGMARRFRLMGLALGLALCAALFIWKNASSFPPPTAAPASDRWSGRTSHAGLLTLLRRHIAPAELVAVCWREWLVTNGSALGPEIRSRVEAVVAESAARPVEAAREIQTLLRAKGRL